MTEALGQLLARHVARGTVPGAVAAIVPAGGDLRPVAAGSSSLAA